MEAGRPFQLSIRLSKEALQTRKMLPMSIPWPVLAPTLCSAPMERYWGMGYIKKVLEVPLVCTWRTVSPHADNLASGLPMMAANFLDHVPVRPACWRSRYDSPCKVRLLAPYEDMRKFLSVCKVFAIALLHVIVVTGSSVTHP